MTHETPSELHRQLAYQRLFGRGRDGWRPLQTGGAYYSDEYMVCRVQPDPTVELSPAMRQAIGSVLMSLNIVGHTFKGELRDKSELLCVPKKAYERHLAPRMEQSGPGDLHYQPTTELLLTNTVDGLLTQRIRETLFHIPGDLWKIRIDEHGVKEHSLLIPRTDFSNDLPFDGETLNALGEAMVEKSFGMPGLHIREQGDDLVFTLSGPLVARIREMEESKGPDYLVGDIQYIEEWRARAEAQETQR